MKLVNDCRPFASCAWFSHRTAAWRTHGVFVCRGEFQMTGDGTVRPWPKGAEMASPGAPHPGGTDPRSASDLVPFKPRADILVVGSAHAPGGKAQTALTVRLRVGPVDKTLVVYGDRWWEGSKGTGWQSSAPLPFTRMEMRYINAFGGAGDPRNPVGKGFAPVVQADGSLMFPRPNIENPEAVSGHPTDRPAPAGFAPLAADWAARAKRGSFDDAWRRQQFPGEPIDFDWGCYNAAPADQQVEGYLRGDEAVECTNLHPDYPLFRSRLPALRPRLLLRELANLDDIGRIPERGQIHAAEIREVPLMLDTLSLDMDQLKMVVVWRGIAEMRTGRMREVQHVLLASEPLADERAPTETLAQRFDEVLAETAQARAGGEKGQKAREQAEAIRAKAAALLAKAKVDAEEVGVLAVVALSQAVADTAKVQPEKSSGDPYAALRGAAASGRPEPMMAALAAVLGREPGPEEAAALRHRYIDILQNELPNLPEDKQALARRAIALADIQRVPLADTLQEQAVNASNAALERAEKMLSPHRPLTPSRAAEVLDGGGPLVGMNFTHHDLSGRDLSGRDLSGANFSHANLSGCRFRGSWLARASVHGANLIGADFTGAVIIDTDFSSAELADACFAATVVAGARFSGRALAGADFTGAFGARADFREADLAGARFTGAHLPQVNFDKAILAGADFTGAVLVKAQLSRVQAQGAILRDADITNMRAGYRADFSDADFRGCHGEKTAWSLTTLRDARFNRARLPRANFAEADLDGANFDRAHLHYAIFDDARLRGAELTNANLLRASFTRADLTRAWVGGSNCYGAGFTETLVDGADFTGSFLAATLMVQS